MASRRPPPVPYAGSETAISIIEIRSKEEMLWISKEALPFESFPPCIRNIIQRTGVQKGSHRTAAILAAFLGQAGWEEAEARGMWSDIACVEERIFTEWFGKMHCPKCETLKRESEGYPDLGIADLDCCRPDKECSEFHSPVEHAAGLKTEEDRSKKGWQKHIKTIHLARVLNWTTGKEVEIELSETERKELEGLLREQKENETLVYTQARVRGRLRPKFSLKVTEGPKRWVLSDFM